MKNQKLKFKSQKCNSKGKSRLLKTFNFLLVLLTFTFCLLTSSEVHAAEQALRVSPVIINVTLSPGKTYTHEVTVENLSNAPMPLRATLNDFLTADEDGGYVFEDSKTNPLLSWITLNEPEFIINPKEKKTMRLTITTPQSISLGGYYGILFFEPVVNNANARGARVSSKIGVLMLANVGVPDPEAQKAEILELKMPLLDADGNIPVLLRVKNISLNFFTAKPIMKITPLITINSSMKELTFEDKIIFPDKVRRWDEPSALQGLPPNIYKLDIAVATGNGQSITTGSYIIVFPYISVLGFILVLTVLIIGIKKQKRLKKALSALIKG